MHAVFRDPTTQDTPISVYNVVKEKPCMCSVYRTFSRTEHWSSKGTEAWSACTLVLAGAPILTHSSTKWLQDKAIKQHATQALVNNDNNKKVMQEEETASFNASAVLSSVSESIVHPVEY